MSLEDDPTTVEKKKYLENSIQEDVQSVVIVRVIQYCTAANTSPFLSFREIRSRYDTELVSFSNQPRFDMRRQFQFHRLTGFQTSDV